MEGNVAANKPRQKRITPEVCRGVFNGVMSVNSDK